MPFDTIMPTVQLNGLNAAKTLRSVEVFSGAGGLGLGLAQAGFQHSLVLDHDPEPIKTLRANQAAGHALVQGWNIHEADARTFDYSDVPPGQDLLAGGPPCQPFSIGGKHLGRFDPRDLWPSIPRMLRAIQPKAFLFENVRGMASPSHANYLEYVTLSLAHPEVARQTDEGLEAHLNRLRRHHDAHKGEGSGLWYKVETVLLDAADFGVPQRRHRLFIVGIREGVTAWRRPAPTHSARALEDDKWATGNYWRRHGLPRPEGSEDEARWLKGHNTRKDDLFAERLQPHRTLFDAIGDLPEPTERAPAHLPNHVKVRQVARPSGTGHTGSPLHMPAKALRAGTKGYSGGENMMDYGTGAYRHFTIREAARLQTFPDDYAITGGVTSSIRQVGNAVPVTLGQVMGASIAASLSAARH